MKTKHEWRIAPHWAKWAATDKWGVLTYWENRPEPALETWVAETGRSHVEYVPTIKKAREGWEKTLESRPTNNNPRVCPECGERTVLWARDVPYGSGEHYYFVLTESYYCTRCETETMSFEQESANEQRHADALFRMMNEY
jgi:DNA-directed RNA polymerase subunit RPC12/RpoP